MYRGHRIAVVVPAYCEERLIGRTLAGLPAFVDDAIVVDDASPDGTSAAARKARPDALILRHPKNRGVGAAIVTGYRATFARGADVVAVMAGDDQMDPADLPALCDAVIDGRADYAKGNRMAHPEVLARMPLWRYAGGLALSYLTRLLTGYPGLSDSQCGYTALSRDAIARLDLDALYPRYGYPNDLLSLCRKAGLRVVDVPVAPRYGDEDSGITPLVAVPLAGVLLRALGRRLAGALR